ncbi:hypothetical protein [Nitrospira sp. Nam74]
MPCNTDAANSHGQWLQYLTIGWNVIESTVGFIAALLAGSIALLGFAFDSAIEVISSLAALRRLRAEHDGKAKRHVERNAHKMSIERWQRVGSASS